MRPRKYNSELKKEVVVIEQRVDNKGEIFFLVEYTMNNGEKTYVTFSALTSAIDFLKSNF